MCDSFGMFMTNKIICAQWKLSHVKLKLKSDELEDKKIGFAVTLEF